MEHITWAELKQRYPSDTPLTVIETGFVDDPDSIYRDKTTPGKTGQYKIIEVKATGRRFTVWRD